MHLSRVLTVKISIAGSTIARQMGTELRFYTHLELETLACAAFALLDSVNLFIRKKNTLRENRIRAGENPAGNEHPLQEQIRTHNPGTCFSRICICSPPPPPPLFRPLSLHKEKTIVNNDLATIWCAGFISVGLRFYKNTYISYLFDLVGFYASFFSYQCRRSVFHLSVKFKLTNVCIRVYVIFRECFFPR